MSVVIAATPQPIHDPDGRVSAYLIPATEFDRLRAEVETLRATNAKLEEQLVEKLPLATPEQEAEMKYLMETAIPDGLDHLIAELEAEGYGNAAQ